MMISILDSHMEETVSKEVIVSNHNGVTISQVGQHDHKDDSEEHTVQHMETNYDADEEPHFDDDVPSYRRMTVTSVTDHAELANSVLSAQSAPTIHLTPMSSGSNRLHLNSAPQAVAVKIEQQTAAGL